ncbi:MAG: Mut7-C RNAse domain-containing protein [Candidatus Jordarchaeales archaeon]
MLAILLFVCDAMLGRVCRWLRLLGYAAYYDPKGDDEYLLEKVVASRGILLTRDLHLYRRALKHGVRAFYVEGTSFYEQFWSVAREFKLRLEVDPRCSFCPKCGGKIREAKGDEVAGIIHPSTLERYGEFWVCTSCGKVYWKGAMWRSMNKVLEKIRSGVSLSR